MADALGALGRFFGELKRRKVYRVAVVYIVVAAGSIELVDLLVPSTRLPSWADELFLSLAVFGFPLAVVLAWAFEVTPEGVVRTSPRAAEERDTPEKDLRGGEDIELDVRSVAVLPFQNLSGAEEAEPFAAGLHDDLLAELSKLSALTVISRTSLMAYRETDKTVRQIGRELGVGTVVEGAVQQAGRRVRLRVQLIDARSDAHRWAERYDRELTPENIFEIQTELAGEIADVLRAELTPEDKRRIGRARVPTRDLEAYRLHAEGRRNLDQRTEEGIGRAIERFRGAIERDPEYAPAWAGLAEAALLLRFYDYAGPETVPDPRTTAERAVELDPADAEAHASLGILHSLAQDGPAALRELQRALELRPSHAEANAWLGWVRLMAGDPSAAGGPAARAVELDPMAPAARAYLAEVRLADGEPEAALREAIRAHDIQPEYALVHFLKGLALHHLGRWADAEEALADALSLARPRGTPSRTEVRAALAVNRAAAGDPAEAREELARLEESDDPFSVGLVRAALGETDLAFEAFARVREWGSFETEHLRYFFPDALGPIREDPRYFALIRELDRRWARDAAPGTFDEGG